MSKPMIDQMVDRFLSWRLPDDFAPDCGISFTPLHPNGVTRFDPVGTNLFTYEQAKEMVRHMLSGVVLPEKCVTAEEVDALERRVAELEAANRADASATRAAELVVPLGGNTPR